MPGKRYTEKEKREMLKTIRKVYEEKGSIRKAGQAAGVSGTTARNWLKEAGVKLRDPRSRNEIEYDPEDLRKWADKGLNVMIKKHRRGCQVIGCERYEKGNRIRLREESIGA